MITDIWFGFASTLMAVLAWLAPVVPADNLATASEAKTVMVTEKDSGSKISLGKGDTLVVKLDGTAGTKYPCKYDKSVLSMQKVTFKGSGERPGGKGTYEWQFKGETVGTSEFEIKQPELTFKLTIKVE